MKKFFGGTWYLILEDRKANLAITQQEEDSKQSLPP
jgi:hypothetical protein